MTNSKDYRLYLEENFQEIKDDLKEIKTQVTLTNGTVREHEKYIVYADQVIENRGKETNGIKTKICELDADVKCLDKKVDEIINEKEIKKFINKSWWDKYSKVLETIGIIIAFLTLFVMIFSDSKRMDRIESKINYLNTPESWRGGAYNPFTKDTDKEVRLWDTIDFDRIVNNME